MVKLTLLVQPSRAALLGVKRFLEQNGITQYRLPDRLQMGSIIWREVTLDIDERSLFELRLKYHDISQAANDYIQENSVSLYKETVEMIQREHASLQLDEQAESGDV